LKEMADMETENWPYGVEHIELKSDPVYNPDHYNAGEIECIDALRSALTKEEFRGLCKGSALQYIWREKWKGGNESIEKAVWYLNRIVRD